VESLPANGRENGHDLQKMNHEQLQQKITTTISSACIDFKESNSKKM
jgi:hypothetical protein